MNQSSLWRRLPAYVLFLLLGAMLGSSGLLYAISDFELVDSAQLEKVNTEIARLQQEQANRRWMIGQEKYVLTVQDAIGMATVSYVVRENSPTLSAEWEAAGIEPVGDTAGYTSEKAAFAAARGLAKVKSKSTLANKPNDVYLMIFHVGGQFYGITNLTNDEEKFGDDEVTMPNSYQPLTPVPIGPGDPQTT